MEPLLTTPPIHTLTAEVMRQYGQSELVVRRVVDQRDNTPHNHVFHELVYIESGTAEHETAAGLQALNPGDLIVIRPLVWHAYRHTRQLTLHNCLFTDGLIRRFADLLRHVPGSVELYRRRSVNPRIDHPIVLHCIAPQQTLLLTRLQSITLEHNRRLPGWELAVTTGLLDVLLMTARMWGRQSAPEVASRPHTESSPLPQRAEEAVLDTVRYLEQHYVEEVDLDELASRVHLSRWHLSRCFAQRMGMGMVQYTHRLRIEQACRRLRQTKDPIGEIALDLGYMEIAYFTRCFKQHLGQSPKEYRKSSWRENLTGRES